MEVAEEHGEDITASFLSACPSIALGELIHCPTFTLFEAMSSIELMDSKMDSGLLANKVCSFSDLRSFFFSF